jgi:DNA-binding transcriptional regulator YdaS (Cro superfamily)
VRTSEVIDHFGSQTAVARAIGISRSAVQQWKEKVPPLSAAKIAKATRGRLKFDPSEYDNWYQKRAS